ncbi:MAG TPA: SRPBCC domain-containing protein [Burkholderiales bacterium]|nr:SRPBCC domain-containing protein [Burkholderiales bacterium]
MKLIKQSVVLPAPAKALYAMYLSPKAHCAITGHPVTIGAKAGSKFKAFNGALSGRILYTVPGRLIVQAWRSTAFKKSDVDSTLILRFTPKGRSGRIDLTHVNVPAHDYRGVNNGWKQYYWRPWRKFLTKSAKPRT